MRYWFLAAAAIVLLSVTGISIKEYREKRLVLSVAQNSIGYIHVVSGPEDIFNANIQLMRENTIGKARNADIILKDPSIMKLHSQVYSVDGDVYVNRLGKGEVTVNGLPISSPVRVTTGDIICFGNIVTRLHLKEED
ncbi:MAG: FHA domain-containing protein [Burkholderiales bacterium]